MAAADWPAPPRDGVTIWHVTDTHIDLSGNRDWPNNHAVEAGEDLSTFADRWNVAARLHTGDLNNSGALYAGEDAYTLDWVNQYFPNASDLWIPGNHDYRDANASNGVRTRTQWEAIYGVSANRGVVATGSSGATVRILGMSCDDSHEGIPGSDDTWDMTPATIAWLDSQLSAHSDPTWLACHYMLQEHGAFGVGKKAQPETELVQLISDHPHVIGWLSGHAHWNINNATGIESLAVGNRAAMPSISGPSTGLSNNIAGGYNAPGVNTSILTTFVDFDRIEVRFRNHGARKWAPWADGNRVKVMTST